MGIRIDIIDIGRTVVCDWCNRDYTDSEDKGGILFGTYAICPACAPGAEKKIRGYGEEWGIKARCPEAMTFADWVRGLRGGDNTIKVIGGEVC